MKASELIAQLQALVDQHGDEVVSMKEFSEPELRLFTEAGGVRFERLDGRRFEIYPLT